MLVMIHTIIISSSCCYLSTMNPPGPGAYELPVRLTARTTNINICIALRGPEGRRGRLRQPRRNRVHPGRERGLLNQLNI